MTPHFLIWSVGPKIGSVDGICHQTDSMDRFYLDVKTGPKVHACQGTSEGSSAEVFMLGHALCRIHVYISLWDFSFRSHFVPPEVALAVGNMW